MTDEDRNGLQKLKSLTRKEHRDPVIARIP